MVDVFEGGVGGLDAAKGSFVLTVAIEREMIGDLKAGLLAAAKSREVLRSDAMICASIVDSYINCWSRELESRKDLSSSQWRFRVSSSLIRRM